VQSGSDIRLEIEGKTFASVVVKGVEVRPNRTTDLGDLLLGDKAVLRGKVIDAKGSPCRHRRRRVSRRQLRHVAGDDLRARAVRAPLRDGERRDAVRRRGAFRAVRTRRGDVPADGERPGFAMNYQLDLVVAPERGAGALTIVLGPGARLTGKVTDEKARPS